MPLTAKTPISKRRPTITLSARRSPNRQSIVDVRTTPPSGDEVGQDHREGADEGQFGVLHPEEDPATTTIHHRAAPTSATASSSSVRPSGPIS